MILPVGTKVKINANSSFYHQGLRDGRLVTGVVIENSNTKGWSSSWMQRAWDTKVHWPYQPFDKWNLYNYEKDLIPVVEGIKRLEDFL